MDNKYYEISIENYHDSLGKKEALAYYPKDTLLDAQLIFGQKMASGINDPGSKHILNLVIGSDGYVENDFKDYFEKYSAEDRRIFRHYVFVVFRYNDGSDDDIFLNGYDTLADAMSNYYSKRSSGMAKPNIHTVTELMFNSNCEKERDSYFWDKYPELESDSDVEEG